MSDDDLRSQLILELASTLAAVAGNDFELARVSIAGIHSRLVNRNAQGALPGIEAPAERVKRDEGRQHAVVRLFAYWQARCDHKAAKLTPERARAIMSRLRDGYSEGELRKAIDGAAVAAYVNEDNGHRFDDLTLICRNGSKLESFINRGVKATGDVVVEVTDSSPVDEQISNLRRQMADLHKDGRQTEYANAAVELGKLMAKRAAR